MNTTIPARELRVTDSIVGFDAVAKLDADTTPGVVYVWLDGNDSPQANIILNHGDPVIIEVCSECEGEGFIEGGPLGGGICGSCN